MMNKSISALAWFWLFIIPLSFNFWGLDPALYSKFLILDISLLFGGLALLIKGDKHFTIPQNALVFISLYGIYILLSLVSLIGCGINLADGWFVWLHLSTLPIFVLLLLLLTDKNTIKPMETAYVISCMAGVSILIGAVQYGLNVYSSGWNLYSSDMMRSTFAHKNIFAEVLLMTFAFSVYASFANKGRRIIARIISLLTILMIAVLLSRAVWLALLVAGVTVVALYYIANGKLKIRWYQPFILIMFLCVSYFAFKWFLNDTVTGDYLSYFYNHRNTVKERQHLWSATWQMIKLHPMWGNGLGSWKILNMKYGLVGLRNYTTFFQQPHNDYLWVWSEQGLVALVVAGAAWALVFYSLVGQILKKPTDRFLYCLLFALVAYTIFSALAFPRERAEHCIILSFITFFILNGDEQKHRSIASLSLLPILIVLAASVWWAGHKMASEIHLRQFFEARNSNDIKAEVRELSAISSTYYTIDGTATPIAWYEGMIYFSQGNIQKASDEFELAVKINPYHAYSLSNVGTCLNQKGDQKGAENYFRMALACSPGFPDAALNLCAIKYNEGQLDSASYYLGMVNDSLTNLRYVKSLNTITKVIVQSLIDSNTVETGSIMQKKISGLLKKTDWQASIFKKAYIYHRTITKQILKDVIWSIQYEDHDSVDAVYFEQKTKN